MGRLSGFEYRDVVQKLRFFGYVFDRHGPGSHEIWRQIHSLPHHPGDMKEGTLRAILRETGIDVEDFLKA